MGTEQTQPEEELSLFKFTLDQTLDWAETLGE
jgi:hypothetical protein